MIRHQEAAEQMAVVAYLRLRYPNVLFSGGFTEGHLNKGWRPRRGRISPGTRRMLMGYKAGTPDLLIFHRKGVVCGLAIEMKAKTGGRASQDQKEFLNALREQGWIAFVAEGAEAAKQMIDAYMAREASK